MTDNNDLRLIEDYLPIEAISKEASREKSVRKGHISTLHLWWARRPLVACRAAVYGALVPADRWVKDVELKAGPDDAAKAEKVRNGKKKGLNRKAAKEFVTKLCRYPKTNPTKPADIKLKSETEAAIVEAQRHILEAHADRLTAELAEARKLPLSDAGDASKPPLPPGEGWGEGAPGWLSEFKWPRDKTVVTYGDIVAGRAPRPRVLDMFAGGGAIPLEALRLGCEAYALDLNPVAHIIQLCTLVYPQKYGKPDPTARGMTGPPLAPPCQGGDGGVVRSWGGLANEVRYWGNWVLERVRNEIGDLYPPIPDPNFKPGKPDADAPSKGASGKQIKMQTQDDEDGDDECGAATVPPGYLLPVAYLWTRTVRCKNPSCGMTVPLVKQTWLCKKKGHYVALKMTVRRGDKQVRFEVVESAREDGFDFDPAGFSEAGSATCPLCGTVADGDYTKEQGLSRKVGFQLLAVVWRKSGGKGIAFLAGDDLSEGFVRDTGVVADRIQNIEKRSGIHHPDELIGEARPSPNARGLTAPTRHGLKRFADLFHPRQLLSLMAQCEAVRLAEAEMRRAGISAEQLQALVAYCAVVVDRMADRGSSLCRWDPAYTKTQSTFGRPALPFVWDFSETNPFGDASGDMRQAMEWVIRVIEAESNAGATARTTRGSALSLPDADDSVDAVVTDPPYYDNVPYADVSDFFYVWLKRTLGHLFSEHFSAEQTPKKNEATALSSRHDGDMAAASRAYEQMMLAAFSEAHRVLKPDGQFVVVYAHKTTLGWATLVEALRQAGFIVTEAWPLDTEFGGRLIALDAAALASSIFLVARKREASAGVGNYEDDVQPELQQIVRERVETLWEMGIVGADLVIACVGAGLRAFTKYEKVEYANGEEVPAEKFLAEVEGVVLDTMMEKLVAPLSKDPHPGPLPGGEGGRSNLSTVDHASRFYVLWRFVYKTAELDAGEAIVFSNGTHIELDGAQGLSAGKDALVEKKKAKYRARDYTERGDDDRLGFPTENGQPAPLIDALHRVLWLMDNSPRRLNDFLDEARPDRERLRVLAQALAGAALSGKSEADADRLVSTTPAEQSALGKLLANWRTLIEEGAAAAVVGKKAAKEDKKTGQRVLPLGRDEGTLFDRQR